MDSHHDLGAEVRGAVVLVAHPAADLYGSDRMLLESISALVGAGAHVVLTVPGPGPLVKEAADRGAVVRFCPTPVLRKALLSPRHALGAAGRAPSEVAAMLRLLREVKPQAVYVSTLTIPFWTVAARLMRRRVVAHVHEAEGAAGPVVRAGLAVPLLFAHQVLVNSRYSLDVLRRSLPEILGPAAKAEVLLNAVAGPSRPVSPRTELFGGLRLVYVGRLSARKGVDVAIRAVAELKAQGIESSLDIVGAVYPGNEAYEQLLVELVQGLGLGDQVRLHGFRPEIWPFLADADACLVPSRLDEPFGNTAVESVLAARPAVVSDTSGLREAGAFGCVQLVPAADSAALAEALRELVEHWPRWRAQAVADASEAAGRHSPERYRLHIAEAVLETPPAPTSDLPASEEAKMSPMVLRRDG